MRKNIVWIGIALILVGMIIGIVADALHDSSYGLIIEAYRSGDGTLVVQSYERDRTAIQVNSVASVLSTLGIAIVFAGLLFEERYRPMPQYYPGQQQGVYSPPQYPGTPPSQYPPQ